MGRKDFRGRISVEWSITCKHCMDFRYLDDTYHTPSEEAKRLGWKVYRGKWFCGDCVERGLHKGDADGA